MKILVNARTVMMNNPQMPLDAAMHWLTQLASNHPDWELIWITEHAIQQSNNKTIVLPPLRHNLLSLNWWYQFKLPHFYKQYKAHLLIHLDGLVCPVKGLNQMGWLMDAGALFKVEKKPTAIQNLFKKGLLFQPRFNCFEEPTAIALQEQYKVPSRDISIFEPGQLLPQQELDEPQRTATRENVAQGNEYFLFEGPIAAAIELLPLFKAFSIFKRRQKSAMPLLIVVKEHSLMAEMNKLLSNYKYREGVSLIDGNTEDHLGAVYASAYAFVYPLPATRFVVPVWEALLHQVPVILPRLPFYEAQFGDAATYGDALDPESVADQLMELFKNETGRARQIEQGNALLTSRHHPSINSSAAEAWLSGTPT